MSQEEILDRIRSNPGIPQSKVGYGRHGQLSSLLRKKLIKRKWIGNGYILFPANINERCEV